MNGVDIHLLYGDRDQDIPWFKKRPATLRYAERLARLGIDAKPKQIGAGTHRPIGNHQIVDGVSHYWRSPYAFDRPSIPLTWSLFQPIRNVMNADAAHWTYPVPSR